MLQEFTEEPLRKDHTEREPGLPEPLEEPVAPESSSPSSGPQPPKFGGHPYLVLFLLLVCGILSLILLMKSPEIKPIAIIMPEPFSSGSSFPGWPACCVF